MSKGKRQGAHTPIKHTYTHTHTRTPTPTPTPTPTHTHNHALGAVPGQGLVPDVGLHRVHPRVDGRLDEGPQLRQAGADLPDRIAHGLVFLRGRGGGRVGFDSSR